MQSIIHKYEVKTNDITSIKPPPGYMVYSPLHMDFDDEGKLCVWLQVFRDEDAIDVNGLTVHILVTGDGVPIVHSEMEYIGTARVGSNTWHAFRVFKEN